MKLFFLNKSPDIYAVNNVCTYLSSGTFFCESISVHSADVCYITDVLNYEYSLLIWPYYISCMACGWWSSLTGGPGILLWMKSLFSICWPVEFQSLKRTATPVWLAHWSIDWLKSRNTILSSVIWLAVWNLAFACGETKSFIKSQCTSAKPVFWVN